MKTPSTALPVRLPLVVLAALLLAASCQCDNLPPAADACIEDADCGQGRCLDNVCDWSSAPDASEPPEEDAGHCEVPCGSGCCGDGQRCELGECRLDCGSAVRCGEAGAEACCGGSQLCFLGACIDPGAACATRADCQQTEYCDPSVGRCLPLTGASACEYRPPAGAFSPGSLWNYSPSGDPYTQVMMAPIVIDVNGDGTPDVLANFFTNGAYSSPGVLRAISGDSGKLLWTTAAVAGDFVLPASSLAAGDLDGSGNITVVAVGADGRLLGFDGKTGTRLWSSRNSAGGAAECRANWGGPSLADLDGDGFAEIVCGLQAFDHTGLLLWSHGLGSGSVGPLSIVLDLDGDTVPEITDGKTALRADGTPFGWTGPGAGGFPASGDFVRADGTLGRDGLPELVVVNGGQVHLVNGQTGALVHSIAIPSFSGSPGNGGPPTVADFDGDGQPEVGVAAKSSYSVFKLEENAGAVTWKVLWSRQVQDNSSSVTGSSVFDFEGDGKAEVVYADEVALHVYRGSDGEEIFTRPHCSGTTYEYPVIVDVNGNGRADIVIAENTYTAAGLGCDPSVTAGIQVFNDAQDNWVNTRQIWNQHAYHVTNVCDGVDQVCGGRGTAGNTYGRIPAKAPSNWRFNNALPGSSAPVLNSFRQNVQGDGLFSAPDLVAAELQADKSGCPATLKLSARIVNKGALGVLPGISVAFYLDESPRKLIGVERTGGRLLPGQSELVTHVWTTPGRGPNGIVVVVDDDGLSAGAASECDETNNEAGPVVVSCRGLQ